MNVTYDLTAYLVLTRLDSSDRTRLLTNLNNVPHFEITDSTLLLVSNSTEENVMKIASDGLKAGTINVIALPKSRLLGVETVSLTHPAAYPGEYPTVFDQAVGAAAK